MTAFQMPRWLDERVTSWMTCNVLDQVAPIGFAVAVHVEGGERTLIAPNHAVRVHDVPGTGEVRVVIVAYLPENDPFGSGLLAELPAVPQEGSQRVKVKEDEVRAA